MVLVRMGCMSVWMSSNAAKGVCVEAKGVMIEYILYIYNNCVPDACSWDINVCINSTLIEH